MPRTAALRPISSSASSNSQHLRKLRTLFESNDLNYVGRYARPVRRTSKKKREEDDPQHDNRKCNQEIDAVDRANAVQWSSVQKRSQSIPPPTSPAYFAIAALTSARLVPTLT
jgi:hypothetical protein